jgi:hypothetical protein
MNLVLIRSRFSKRSTLGRLYVDGKLECWTLEDAVRPGPKVPGETAIPAGHYPVRLTYSPRFRRELPLVVGVPGFEGIRIHPGNTDVDTEGCILVGRSVGSDRVNESRLAFDALYPKLEQAARIHLTIIDFPAL